MVALSALVGGCAGEQETSLAWRDVDPCSLADADQVAKLDQSGADQAVTEPIRSDYGGPGCHWDRYLQISIVGDVASASDSSRAPQDPVGNPPARTFDLEGRHVTVTAERGGRCSVFTRYSQAQLTVSIEVARSKTNIDTADTSQVSCDAQKPLIGSILSRVDLS
ncbi:hypothetical protein [Nocardia callitridis]|uniref:DUF3558 domain-containing protein n=1 Tax=Nocardia callitridis TaxID=648753 RepID=A0ABP9L3V7_9NOCA